jgi:hypothetical protein
LARTKLRIDASFGDTAKTLESRIREFRALAHGAEEEQRRANNAPARRNRETRGSDSLSGSCWHVA